MKLDSYCIHSIIFLLLFSDNLAWCDELAISGKLCLAQVISSSFLRIAT